MVPRKAVYIMVSQQNRLHWIGVRVLGSWVQLFLKPAIMTHPHHAKEVRYGILFPHTKYSIYILMGIPIHNLSYASVLYALFTYRQLNP